MSELWERIRPYLRDWRVLTGIGVVLVAGVAGVILATRGEPVAAPEPTTTTTEAPTTTAPTTTTTTTVPLAWPLTGQPAPDEEAVLRRVLVVKVENSPQGRPQVGLAQADLVIEALVEGGIARLLGFYHSQDAEEVGPVRSVREVDPKLVAPFVPMMAHSGGVPFVETALREVAFDVGQGLVPSGYRRDPSRPAVHDLMADPEELRTLGPPPMSEPLVVPLTFSAEPPEGEPAATVELDMSPAHRVVYRWSEVDGGYLRYHGAQPHEDADGRHVSTSNVVVLFVEELDTGRRDVAGAPVPDWEVLGTGQALVFRDGTVATGRWERGRLEDFFRLIDEEGEPIPLRPGTTWFELVPLDRRVEWS